MVTLQCVFVHVLSKWSGSKMLIYTNYKKWFLFSMVRLWLFKWELIENADLHTWYENVFVCAFSNCNTLKMLAHKLYKKMLPFWCVFPCLFSFLNYVKMLIYTLEERIFFQSCPMKYEHRKNAHVLHCNKKNCQHANPWMENIYFLWYLFECIFLNF